MKFPCHSERRRPMVTRFDDARCLHTWRQYGLMKASRVFHAWPQRAVSVARGLRYLHLCHGLAAGSKVRFASRIGGCTGYLLVH